MLCWFQNQSSSIRPHALGDSCVGNARDRISGYSARKAHQRPDLSERVRGKIRCGNAWRESRIERLCPIKKRRASLCQDRPEKKAGPPKLPQRNSCPEAIVEHHFTERCPLTPENEILGARYGHLLYGNYRSVSHCGKNSLRPANHSRVEAFGHLDVRGVTLALPRLSGKKNPASKLFGT